MGEVLHLFQAVERGAPVREFDQVSAVVDKGFEGCLHGRPGSRRQVLLMDVETLDEFAIIPGRVKENITTRGIALGALREGQRLKVGEAQLEVTVPCTPCHKMEEIRQGLMETLDGRRGILCRVVESGRVRRGDRIEVLGEAHAAKTASPARGAAPEAKGGNP